MPYRSVECTSEAPAFCGMNIRNSLARNGLFRVAGGQAACSGEILPLRDPPPLLLPNAVALALPQ